MARNYDLVSVPDEDYFCPVSFELLVEANQTACCGSHLSEKIASKLEIAGKPCPICNEARLKTTKDLYFRRQVGQVAVYCVNKKPGCKWEGPVRNLETHLGFGNLEGECQHVSVPCPYLCMRHIKRKQMKRHVTESCPKRPYACNYCNLESSHDLIINDHLPVCDKFPTHCPNGCDELMCRADMKAHVEVCPLRTVKCEFEFAGCAPALRWKNFEKHMEENVRSHLEILAKHAKKRDREVEGLKAQLQVLTNTVANLCRKPRDTILASNAVDIGFIKPSVIIMKQFQEYHTKKLPWKSPPFYSHLGGYKMCLVIVPGHEPEQPGNEFLGVYLQFLEGEYDDILKWPFYGKVEVRLLNWLSGNKGHVDTTLLDASSYSKEGFQIVMVDRASRNPKGSVWGCGSFLPMKDLTRKKTEETQYLQDNSIKFEVLDIALLP